MSFIHAADKIRQPSYEEFSSNSESSPSSSNSLKDSLPAGVNVYSSSGGDEVSAAITTPKKSTSKSEPPLPDPFEDINPFGANAVTSSAKVRPDTTSFSEYNPRSSSSAFTDDVVRQKSTDSVILEQPTSKDEQVSKSSPRSSASPMISPQASVADVVSSLLVLRKI